MLIKQLSVFLENRAGRLDEVTEILGNAGINILALSLADTSDFGILRLIVNKPDEAVKALSSSNFTVKTTDVISVEIAHEPGGLAKVLATLKKADVNVEYMYGFSAKEANKAIMVFRVEDNDIAVNKLQEAGFNVLKNSQILSF